MIVFKCSNIKCQRPADYEKKIGRTPGGHLITRKIPNTKCPVCNSDVKPMEE